jgi:hypothetical protein
MGSSEDRFVQQLLLDVINTIVGFVMLLTFTLIQNVLGVQLSF